MLLPPRPRILVPQPRHRHRTAGSAADAKGGGSASWSYSPSQLRGRNGERFTHHCTPGGTFHLVWGTDIYSDDSAVCVAAVHMGLITYAQGGTVAFEIRPGQPSYTGSARNGVQTGNWGSWPGSFVLVGAQGQ
jgi:hypothetical protein